MKIRKVRFRCHTLGMPTQRICEDYPNCDCYGHFVYEENKRRRSNNKKDLSGGGE